MNRIIDRFQAHFQTVKSKNLNYDVSHHFNQSNQLGVKDIKVYILDFIYAGPRTTAGKALRDIIEFHWIHRLRTTLPMGINTINKASHFGQAYKMWKANKQKALSQVKQRFSYRH